MNDVLERPIFEARQLTKVFTKAGKTIEVLDGMELSMKSGEVVGILGASGAGKSTLLHIAGGLDSPSSGTVHYGEKDIFSLSEPDLAAFRNQKIGFVFQMHYLLAEFTCLENVMMPGIIAGGEKGQIRERAEVLLKQVGLSQRGDHRPGELSGGEQQRAAVARALVNHPSMVLADEPTGNLDAKTAASVQDLFLDLNETQGTTFLVVTHNREMASRFHRRFQLRDGVLHQER
ncbi:MAG: ABC transporter ATP-binding protein [bacterium]|nr:ABC transporter ATP-binding protein [bacterium]MDT8365315.1 ABC transporter ATP-binding protein [bacterium]